jgi:GGDEF domain-containing protein
VTGAVTTEVVRRLDQLIRSGDLLAQLEPGCVALGLQLAPASAGSVVERMRAAASMPVELDGELVALDAVVGVAIAAAEPWDAGAASTLLDRALAEARLQADRGRRP